MQRTFSPRAGRDRKGYSNGVLAEGRTLFIAGQIGWNEQEKFESDDFVAQTEQALKNIVAVLKAAGGEPRHIARMTWYVVDKREYLGRLAEIGKVYKNARRGLSGHVARAGRGACRGSRRVEIEATAVIPETRAPLRRRQFRLRRQQRGDEILLPAERIEHRGLLGGGEAGEQFLDPCFIGARRRVENLATLRRSCAPARRGG